MAKYFIYFSASGNGDYLASLYESAGYTIKKVETIKPFGKVNFFRIMKYGFLAGLQKKAKIKELELDLKDNDEVIIGSPIWNDRLSTPINALLAKLEFNKETTKFILYPAGQTTNKSFKQIADLGFKETPVVVPNPLKNKEAAREQLGI